MAATVEIRPEAVAQIEALPRAMKGRIASMIERLRQWPEVSGVKSLKGNLAGWYRLRTGDYRVQFQVAHVAETDQQTARLIVIVERVGHRKEIYDE